VIELTDKPIDAEALLAHVRSPQAGAAVLFSGTTREMTAGRRTLWLDYDGYREMAARSLAKLEEEARRRWPVIECAIVHRLGRVDLGEASVMVAVSTPHRREAFEAGQWLIDQLKESVPIWKKENWDDGTSQWVHPGLAADQEQSYREVAPVDEPLVKRPTP
jgi:molybdopterin synthase catalytic subunit